MYMYLHTDYVQQWRGGYACFFDFAVEADSHTRQTHSYSKGTAQLYGVYPTFALTLTRMHLSSGQEDVRAGAALLLSAALGGPERGAVMRYVVDVLRKARDNGVWTGLDRAYCV